MTVSIFALASINIFTVAFCEAIYNAVDCSEIVIQPFTQINSPTF